MTSAAIGVAGVACSVNYGASGTKRILDQIRRMGTNVLIVTPAKSRVVAGRARTGGAVTTLVPRDYAVIRRELTAITRFSALVSTSCWIKAGDLSKNTVVVGCEPSYFGIKDWATTLGQLFDLDQERTASRVALLGREAAIALFGPQSPVGQRIMINRTPFVVIGVLAERGQGLDVANEDSQIFVPLGTAMRRLMNVDHYDGLVFEINSLQQMDSAADALCVLLRQSHHIRLNQHDDFQVQNQKTILETQQSAAGRLQFFLRWIAASALSVSGLGMFGISWIAVKERTREIGTRRALGATSADIFVQITFESVALALVGCTCGLAISWPVSRALARSAFVFDTRTAIVAFWTAALLCGLFALWPSRNAAQISPLAALRYE